MSLRCTYCRSKLHRFKWRRSGNADCCNATICWVTGAYECSECNMTQTWVIVNASHSCDLSGKFDFARRNTSAEDHTSTHAQPLTKDLSTAGCPAKWLFSVASGLKTAGKAVLSLPQHNTPIGRPNHHLLREDFLQRPRKCWCKQ